MKKLPLENPSFLYLEKSFRQWLDILGYAPHTVYNLPNHIRELLHYLEQKDIYHIRHLSNEILEEYYKQLQQRSNSRHPGALSSSSLNKHIQAIERFMVYLRKSGRMTLPVMNLKREQMESQQITVLTKEEIQQLFKATENYNEGSPLEAFNFRDRAMLTVCYCCGLRRNEAYHLDVDDVHFDQRLLYVRKGKNYQERMVPINKAGLKALEEYVFDWRGRIVRDKKESALFISQRERRMEGQSMALRLQILQQRCDHTEIKQKKVTLHSLRHSIATHLLEAGMPLQQISKFLGHSSLESTQIYTHLIGEQL